MTNDAVLPFVLTLPAAALCMYPGIRLYDRINEGIRMPEGIEPIGVKTC